MKLTNFDVLVLNLILFFRLDIILDEFVKISLYPYLTEMIDSNDLDSTQ